MRKYGYGIDQVIIWAVPSESIRRLVLNHTEARNLNSLDWELLSGSGELETFPGAAPDLANYYCGTINGNPYSFIHHTARLRVSFVTFSELLTERKRLVCTLGLL